MELPKKLQSKLTSVPENVSVANSLDPDEQAIRDFKMKYQKSLEAIQSLQEILELKKEMGSIKHTYDPSKAKSKPNAKHNIVAKLKGLARNYDPEKKIEPFVKLSPIKIRPQDFDQERIKDNPLNKSQKSFRIRNNESKLSRSVRDMKLEGNVSSLRLESEPNFRETYITELSQKKSNRPQSARRNQTSTEVDIPVYEVDEEPFIIDDEDPDYLDKMKLVYFTNLSAEELEQYEKNPYQGNNIDKIMKEPFIKIKIKNLYNFKVKPLEHYDLEILRENDPAMLYKLSGIDKGYSKFLSEKGKLEWRPCEIVDFDEKEQLFVIRWRHDGSLKKVTRLNFMYAFEKEHEFEMRLKNALENRYRNLYLQSYDQMLTEKAHKEEDMKYPMDNLKNIVNFAFRGIENLEELASPYRLVDEMLDHYKKEVIKYSLECYNYHPNNLDPLVRMIRAEQDNEAKKKHSRGLAETDIAFEVVDVEKKHLYNILDPSQYGSINFFEHSAFDFTEEDSTHVFYKIQATASGIPSSWPPPAIISFMEKIDYQNMFIIDEDESSYDIEKLHKEYQLLRTKTVEEETVEIKRVRFRRDIFLVNQLKAHDIKTDRKYKFDDLGSNVIQAFAKDLYKSLPKPIEEVGETLLEISIALSRIAETRIFKEFSSVTNNRVLHSIKDLEPIVHGIQKEAEKYQGYCDQIVDSIQNLKVHLMLMKNELLEYDTTKRILTFANTMVQSNVKYSVRESLNELIESWEQYACVLPLPYIDQEIASFLPDFIYQMRQDLRKKFNLEEENYVCKLSTTSFLSVQARNENIKRMDKNIISKLMVFILSEIENNKRKNRLFRDSFKDFTKERIKPLFNIRYFVKQNISTKKYRSMSAEERKNIRETCRNKIEKPKQFEGSLVEEIFEDKDEKKEEKPKQETHLKFITKINLGWLNVTEEVATHEPQISAIEEHMKLSILSGLETLSSLRKVDLKVNLDHDLFITKHGLEIDLFSFRSRVEDVVKSMSVSFFALILSLQNFDFYISQEATYTKDIIEAFNKKTSTKLPVITDEMRLLLNDHDKISTTFPKIFDLGMLSVDATDYFEKIKEKIMLYVTQFKNFLETRLIDSLKTSKKSLEETTESLKIKSENMRGFIELKLYVDDETKWNDVINKLVKNINECQEIIEKMEEFSIDQQENTLRMYLESKNWIAQLEDAKKKAELKIQEMRPKLIREQKKKNEELKKNLELLNIKIHAFANCYDLEFAEEYNGNSKRVMGELIELEDNAREYEENEIHLTMNPKTNFDEVFDARANFDKYYKLWDFYCDKWQAKSENWKNSYLEDIDLVDMFRLINQGISTLDELAQDFRTNANITEIIRMTNMEVNRMSEIYKVLEKLKSPAFKTHHWIQLLDEIYRDLTTKPDHSKITLRKLLEDRLMNFQPIINKLYNEANHESKVEKSIRDIEKNLHVIQVQTNVFSIEDMGHFYHIHEISMLMPKLNDNLSLLTEMQSTANYPINLQEKMSKIQYSIRKTKEILETIEEIQKRLLRVAPVMRFKEHYKFFKDKKVRLFSDTIRVFRIQLEGLQKRKKLEYFFNLFDIQSEEDRQDYGDITGEKMMYELKNIMIQTEDILEDIPQILRYARNQCPRLHFFSDAQVLQILTLDSDPDVIALHFLWGFTGIKKLEIKGDFIEGVTTIDNHVLKFNLLIFIQKETDKSNFFVIRAINELEKEIRDSFKLSLSQNIKTIMKYPYDFYEKFKQSKKLFLQMIQLCQDIQFYHDITIMLAIAQRYDLEPRIDDTNQKLIMFKETLITNLKKFIENQEFKTASDRILYMRYCQYIFQIKHHIEILENLIACKINNLETFEYLILPKPMIEYAIEPVRSKSSNFVDITIRSIKKFFHTISTPDEFALFNDSSEYMKFCTQNIYNYDIVIRSMNYKIKYGYELTNLMSPMVHTPTTERCFISMIGALATRTGSIINGSKHTGKVETIRSLASLLGKEIFLVEPTGVSYDYVSQLIFGSAKNSFWVVFQNIHDYPFSLLSTMAQQITIIKQTFAKLEPRVDYGDLLFELKADSEWGLFATFSVSEHKTTKCLDSAPKSFTDNFRVINFLNPHLAKILSLYFEVFRFENASGLANGVIRFFQILSNGIENQVFFDNDISIEDIKSANILNLKPNFALVKKILRYIQKKITNHTHVHYSKTHRNLLWDAILYSLTGILHSQALPRIEMLFNNIFPSTIELEELQEEATKTEFDDHFNTKIPKAMREIPEFKAKCFEVYDTIEYSPNKFKTLLFVGNAGSGRSLVLSTVAKLFAYHLKKNFYIAHLDVDSTSSMMLIGGNNNPKMPRYMGLIELMIETAFIPDSEHHPTLLRPAFYKKVLPNEPENTMPLQKEYNWIVVEGCYDKKFKENIDVFERLLSAARTGYMIAYDGLKIMFPETMKLCICCEKISHLSPSHIAELNLIYVDDTMINFHNDFKRRVSILVGWAEYFKTIQTLLDNLFEKLISPVIKLATSDSESKNMIFHLSHKYMFLNFFDMFEIFLNECRKVEISYGNVNEADFDRFNKGREDTIKTSSRRKSSMFFVEEDGQQVPAFNQTRSVYAGEHSNRINGMVESSCIFCLIWSIGALYRPQFRNRFSKNFVDKIRKYYALSEDNSSNYSFMRILKKGEVNKLLFDYCFDVRDQRWIQWELLNIIEDQVISSSFVDLKADVKTNPRAIAFIESTIAKTKIKDLGVLETVLPDNPDHIYDENITTKRMRFIMDFMIAYKKPVLFVSEPQNCKTSVFKQKIRIVLNNNRQKAYYYSITPLTSKESLARSIEDSLKGDARDRYSAGKSEGIIFIDDVHLSSVEQRPWALMKSFSDFKGWFNQAKNTFILLENISMVAASSHSFEHTENVFDDSFSNLPKLFLMKTNIFCVPEMTLRELRSVFKNYSAEAVSDLNKPNTELFTKLLKQLAKFYFTYKKNLNVMSQVLGCNMSIQMAFQFLKNLELWELYKEMSSQKLLNIWYYNLKRSFGTQFYHLQALSEEYITENIKLNESHVLGADDLPSSSDSSDSDESEKEKNKDKSRRSSHVFSEARRKKKKVKTVIIDNEIFARKSSYRPDEQKPPEAIEEGSEKQGSEKPEKEEQKVGDEEDKKTEKSEKSDPQRRSEPQTTVLSEKGQSTISGINSPQGLVSPNSQVIPSIMINIAEERASLERGTYDPGRESVQPSEARETPKIEILNDKVDSSPRESPENARISPDNARVSPSHNKSGGKTPKGPSPKAGIASLGMGIKIDMKLIADDGDGTPRGSPGSDRGSDRGSEKGNTPVRAIRKPAKEKGSKSPKSGSRSPKSESPKNSSKLSLNIEQTEDVPAPQISTKTKKSRFAIQSEIEKGKLDGEEVKKGRNTGSALNSPQKEMSEKSNKGIVEEEVYNRKDIHHSGLLNKEIRIPITLDLSRNSIIISRKGSNDEHKSSRAQSGKFKEHSDDNNHNILQFPDANLKRSVSHDDDISSHHSQGISRANSDDSVVHDREEYDSESLKSENFQEQPHNELAIESSDSLRNMPRDCMNILVKLMINPNDGVDFKISEDVVDGSAFPFNMSLIGLQTEAEANNNPRFKLIGKTEIFKKEQITNYLHRKMHEYLEKHKSAIIIFNNFTARLSTLIPDISALLMELQTPKQHLLVSSLAQPLYALHMIKFSSFLLDLEVFSFPPRHKKNMDAEPHATFINELTNVILMAILDKKCIFVIVIDAFRPNQPEVSKETAAQYMKILQDLNAFMSGNSLEGVISYAKITRVLGTYKKTQYDRLPESHLIYLTAQKIQENVKFVILGEEGSFKVNDVKFRFEQSNLNLSFMEIMLKYFPQTYLQFRPLRLNEFELKIDKRIIMNQNIFALNLDDKLSNLFENTYAYEIKYSALNDEETGETILPSFREGILMADFIHRELTSSLLQKQKSQKSLGEGLLSSLKKIKHRIAQIDHQLTEKRNMIAFNQEEIEIIKKEIVRLTQDKEKVSAGVDLIRRDIDDAEKFLRGLNAEEETFKDLNTKFLAVTNYFVVNNSKEYLDEIKSKNFLTSKFFTMYSILWGLLFNYSEKDEKVNPDLDLANIKLLSISPERVASFHREFTKVVTDLNILKSRLAQFKLKSVTEANSQLMFEFIQNNDLVNQQIKYKTLQKNLMKWIDLAVEASKFELRKGYRYTEILNTTDHIKLSNGELTKRTLLINGMEQVLDKQPLIIEQIEAKIHTLQMDINSLEVNKERLATIHSNTEEIIKVNFELNNPCASNRELYPEYILATSLYITHCSKYSSQIRTHLFKLILNNMHSDLNFFKYKINEVLYGENFMIDCLKKNIPMSQALIDNLAIYDFIHEINFLYPIVIDRSGLFLNFLKKKHEENKEGFIIVSSASDPETINNIHVAIKAGKNLVLADFDRSVLQMLDPVITWKYEQWINRLHKQHTTPEYERNFEEEVEVVLGNDEGEKIESNGEKIRINPDFKLTLIIQNNKMSVSRFFLERLFIINNDTTSETSWKEAVSDVLLSNCYQKEKEDAIKKYLRERLYSDANDLFASLAADLKSTDFSGELNIGILSNLKAKSIEVKELYIGKKVSRVEADPEVQVRHKKRSMTLFRKIGTDSSNLGGLTPDGSKSVTPSNSRLRNIINRERASFFKNSKSISDTSPLMGNRKIQSNFLMNKNISEYSNIFAGFEDLMVLLEKHSKMLDSMYLLKQTLQLIDDSLGSIYSFSEYNFFFNLVQAFEITIQNGYFRKVTSPAPNEDTLKKFENMVFINLFHQLYATLRKDHQNVFSFFYAIYTLKYSGNFNDELWRHFLKGEIAMNSTRSLFQEPQGERNWIILSKFFVSYFRLCDDKIPTLQPFRSETLNFLKTQDMLYEMVQEGSVFHKAIQHKVDAPVVEVKSPTSPSVVTIGNNPTPSSTNTKDFLSPNSQSTPNNFKRIVQGMKIVPTKIKDDDRIYSPHLTAAVAAKLDLPKIPTTDHRKNYAYHSYLVDSIKTNAKNTKYGNEGRRVLKIGDATPVASNNESVLGFTEATSPIKIAAEKTLQFTDDPPGSDKKTNFQKTTSDRKEPDSPLSNADEKEIKLKLAESERVDPLKEATEKSKNIASGFIRFVKFETKLKKNKDGPQTLEIEGSTKAVQHDTMIRGQSLNSLTALIPEIPGLIADMEKDKLSWIKFLNRSLYTYKVHNRIFPQFPGNWNDKLSNPLQILAVIKYIRPDALETYITAFLAEVKHRSFALLPRTNFETHARSKWYKKPTIVFFGRDLKNPSETVEMLSAKNNKNIRKVSLGDLSLEVVFKALAAASQLDSWVVLENLHLVMDETLKILIRKINSTLDEAHENFKLWITCFIDTDIYSGFHLSQERRRILEPFCKTCFKTYLNVNDGIKSKMFEYYKFELADYYSKLEKNGGEIVDQMEDIKDAPDLKISYLKLENYKQKFLADDKNKIDLYEFFQNKINKVEIGSMDLLKELGRKGEIQKIRFTINFIFSIIRERMKYEMNLPVNFGRTPVKFVGDNDLTDVLNHILHFVEYQIFKNPKYEEYEIEEIKDEAISFVEKFICFHFSFDTDPSSSFHAVNMKSLFRKFVNSNGGKIDVKGNVTYEMLYGNYITPKNKFDCIHNLPNDDPIEILGFQVNNLMLHTYRFSKRMFDFMIRSDEELEKKEKVDTQCQEIEKNVLEQEFIDLEECLNEYLSHKQEQTQKESDSSLSLVFLLIKLSNYLPKVLEIKDIEIFSGYRKTRRNDYEGSVPNSPHKKKTEGLGEAVLPNKFHIDKKPARSLALSLLKNSRDTKRPDSPKVEDPMKNSEKSNKDLNNSIMSINSRKAADEDERFDNKHIFMNIILNEIKHYNRTLSTMKDDLQHAIRIIKGFDHVEESHPVYRVIQDLLNNEIPSRWYENSSLPVVHTDTIVDFFKIFSLKYENLKVLIDRNCVMHPLMPLSKMFDPFFVFTSMLWAYARMIKCPIQECELIMLPIDKPPGSQMEKGGIHISGLVISGGRLNLKTYFLEDELAREFSSTVPAFLVKVKKRNPENIFIDEDNTIPATVRVSSSDYNNNITLFPDKPNYDKLVKEYHDYMIEFNNYDPDNPKKEQKSYSVRIPVVDPCFKLSRNSFNVQIYLYLKSKKPQEWWQMKGTSALIQMDV